LTNGFQQISLLIWKTVQQLLRYSLSGYCERGRLCLISWEIGKNTIKMLHSSRNIQLHLPHKERGGFFFLFFLQNSMLNPVSDGINSQAASKLSTNCLFSSSIIGASILRASLKVHRREIIGSSIIANGASGWYSNIQPESGESGDGSLINISLAASDAFFAA
jgi:hypothetical protein